MAFQAQGDIVFCIDPDKALLWLWCLLRLSQRICVGQPGEIDARRDWQPDPLPDAGIDVQQLVLSTAFIIDKFDFSDSLIMKGFENLHAASGDFIYTLACDKAAGSKVGGILFQFATDEGAVGLTIAPDIGAERIEVRQTATNNLLSHQ